MGFVDNFLDKMKLGSNYDDDEYEGYDDDDADDDDAYVSTRQDKKKSESIFSSGASSLRKSDPDDNDDESDDTMTSSKGSASKAPHKTKPVQKNYSKSNQKVVSMRERTLPMEVCVIKPVTVEDGREIADTLLNGRAVILNLEGLDVELAQRIIDFTSGACFAIQGNLQRVSNYIFIVTPNSIEISGDIQELLSESFSINAGNSTQGPSF